MFKVNDTTQAEPLHAVERHNETMILYYLMRFGTDAADHLLAGLDVGQLRAFHRTIATLDALVVERLIDAGRAAS